jgi:molybdate transport system ATP-binding protein
MDEPLAALDATRREEILPYIARLRDEMKLPMVYVSHSVDEVTRLADTVVLLAGGTAIASGSVNEVFGRIDLLPHTGRYEASTVVVGRVVAHDPEAGTTMLDHPAGRMWVPIVDRPEGTELRLRVRARDVALAVGEPGLISIRNRLKTTVMEIAEDAGGSLEVRLDAGGQPLLARITRDAARALDLEVDQPVTALIKSAAFDQLEDAR